MKQKVPVPGCFKGGKVMLNFKEIIAEKIADVTKINEDEIKSYIEIPKDSKNGDYAFPCFRLAKELKKAPPIIANEIKEKLDEILSENQDEIIEKIEIAGGYLNFFINKNILVSEVLKEISSNEEYGKSELGNGKNIIVEYSAPNIVPSKKRPSAYPMFKYAPFLLFWFWLLC